MIDFSHAQNIAHHYARLLGIDREANGFPTWAHQHGRLDARAQKAKLVQLVDRMRSNSYVTSGEQGQLLVEFADHLRAELGLPPPGGE
jgi:hypothetical protein